MAEQKKLSVAEMLAAARGNKGAPATPAAEKPAEKPAEAAAETPAEAEAPAAAVAETPAEKPAAKPAAKPAGGKLSVAEMMAAARASKGAAAAKPAEAPKAETPKPAPAPKPAAEKAKPAPKEKEGAVATAEKDTASMLSGGPKKDKPGPMTKAEAAAKETPETAAAKTKVKPVAPPMPAKPAYAAAKPGKAGAEVERRGFIVACGMVLSAMLGSAMGIGFTAISATFGLWGLATARFMFPNVLREPPSRFKVGFKSDFPFGKVEEKYKAQYGVWVVNFDYNGQREIYALSTVCTHLGCTPNWLESEQKFKCPCHGSGFYKDGINFEGPAPRPLERYAIRIADDGQLEIDKSRKFQEEMGQWDDPSSFVTV